MKQISIVMPLIGACEWLTETLESIEAQSFPHDAIETITSPTVRAPITSRVRANFSKSAA